MIRYYCKKCNAENPSPVCAHCGKKLSGNTMRNVWRVYRLPLSDSGTWFSVLSISALIALLLFLILFGAEFFMTGLQQMTALFSTNLPAVLFALIPLSLCIACIVLTLQGREILLYALDMQGAHLQTWHDASRIKCWARLQLMKPEDAVPQQDGTQLIMAQVRHMLWKDVRQVRYSPRKGEIRLYHTPHIAPMVLRLPPEEYEGCEALVKKFCKGK